jgi:beta-lactamase regulating signal transducer with metallopeptidase domain
MKSKTAHYYYWLLCIIGLLTTIGGSMVAAYHNQNSLKNALLSMTSQGDIELLNQSTNNLTASLKSARSGQKVAIWGAVLCLIGFAGYTAQINSRIDSIEKTLKHQP